MVRSNARKMSDSNIFRKKARNHWLRPNQDVQKFENHQTDYYTMRIQSQKNSNSNKTKHKKEISSNKVKGLRRYTHKNYFFMRCTLQATKIPLDLPWARKESPSKTFDSFYASILLHMGFQQSKIVDRMKMDQIIDLFTTGFFIFQFLLAPLQFHATIFSMI